MWPEIQRKLFHLGAFIYAVGATQIPRPKYLKILCLILVIEGLAEWARLRYPPAQAFLARHFGSLLRPSESSRPTGIFWMLLGVITAVALLKSVPLLVAAILYTVL